MKTGTKFTMWPTLLDMTKEESVQYLRHLELEAYSTLVSALRAQGPLNSDKRKLLKESGLALNITQERHKAEIRRAISDEKLTTIAYHVTGMENLDEWSHEGRRLTPLLPRSAPQTAYSAISDEVAEIAHESNQNLPLPANTERKRSAPVTNTINTPAESIKVENKLSFRIPDTPKADSDSKKRKISISENSSCLAQHLLGPSKTSRIQQIYRQKTKAKTKEQFQMKLKQELEKQALVKNTYSPQSKINVLQNISIQPPTPPVSSESVEQTEPESANNTQKSSEVNHTVPSNENQAPRNKILSNVKQPTSITLKQLTCSIPGSSDVQKTLKMCSSKKTLTKPNQKLIVVSNAPTIPSSSILQRTLSIPFVKNMSVKNFEKFKIVTSSASTSVPTSTNANSANSVKHKVVTVRTNQSTKKVIPLSQLQVLNSKGSIKVLPIGSKIVGKSVASSVSSPLYIMNTTAMNHVQTVTKSAINTPVVVTNKIKDEPDSEQGTSAIMQPSQENGKSTVLEDILKASGIEDEANLQEDYDMKIDEFHIHNLIKKEPEVNCTTSDSLFEENLSAKGECKSEPDELVNGVVEGVETVIDYETLTEEVKEENENVDYNYLSML